MSKMGRVHGRLGTCLARPTAPCHLALLLVLAGLALAACGGQDTAPSAAPSSSAHQAANGPQLWAVSTGTSVISADGGRSWQLQQPATPYAISPGGFDFTGAKHAWIEGDTGQLLSTSDGGAHWRLQGPHTSNNYLAIDFPDLRHGWVVGDGGFVGATADGGIHWRIEHAPVPSSWGTSQPGFPAPMGTYLMSVSFVDARRGWVVGDGGVILATHDAGTVWRRQPSGASGNLLAVCFIDDRRGWLVGDGGLILATSDGGNHWLAQVSGTSFDLDGLSVIDAEHGWAVGSNSDGTAGMILATNDGGRHWRQQDRGLRDLPWGVTFVDVRHGWVVGSDFNNNGRLWLTSDGGLHWQRESLPPSCPDLEGLYIEPSAG